MFFFKRKKQHEQAAQKITKDINSQFAKARKSIAQGKRELTTNGITLEIRKGLGAHHV